MSFGASSFGERAFGEPSGVGAPLDLSVSLLDPLYLSPTPTGETTYLRLFSESLFFTEGTCHCDFITLISDDIDFSEVTDQPSWALIYVLNEISSWGDNIIQDSTYNPLFDEDLVFADAVREVFAWMLSDALDFRQVDEVVSYVRSWDSRLRELFNFTDVSTDTGVYNRLIAEALALADLASHPERETLSENLSFAQLDEVLAGLADYYDTLVSSIVTEDTSQYVALFSGSLSDLFATADTVSRTSIVQALLEDEFRFYVWQGDTQTAYTGYVMNTKLGGLTEYQNYNFNSIARVGGSYYGASDTGLYLLEGDDDAGTDIEAKVKFGAFDPGLGHKSRIEHAYIGVRTDGKIIFKTFADDGKERWYETQALHDDLQTQRAKLGRGVKSRYWQFELMNRDGEALDLEQFEFLPIALTRRV